jgi:hypothetical protein
MRRLMFAATLIATTAGVMALAAPGEAAGKVRYKYCTSSTNEGIQCMYQTYAACRADARGTGADCIRNPRSYRARAAY